MNAEPIVRVEQLSAQYGDRVVFDQVSFQVEPGEIMAILGSSGCGKSTLLKHMIGLYRPASGRIWIDAEEFTQADEPSRLRIMRKFGVMYQMGALFGSMDLLENVSLPLEELTSLPAEAIRTIAASKLRLVQLAGFERYMPSEISGGMRKRAAIARAMALDPRLLFLDEPSAGLDPITSAELDQTILHLSRALGVTFVIVTHELASIYAIADRVIMLDKRTRGIIASGTPRELRDHCEDEWVQRFFRREAGPESGRPN